VFLPEERVLGFAPEIMEGHGLKQMFLSVLLSVALAACAQNGDTSSSTPTDTAVTSAETTTSAAAESATMPAATPATEEKLMSYENKVAELHTSAGQIDIRFFSDVAPNHVKNFLDLAQQGFYDGTKFHRTIPGFMIQGGDPNTKGGDPSMWGTGGSGKNVKAEFNSVKHKRGIVSMARSTAPDSASSQFFIMVADYPSLDNNYSAFGQVTKGMDVADKIVSGPADRNDRPANPVTIDKIVIRDAREDEKGPTPK
jgi:peptidyl-prolyl cis-trans isomerase B (cyclophilin B)